jgi:transposase-like protein
MSKRRAHSPEFKARIAMEAISGRKTIQEIAANHAIHPIQVSQWKRQPSMFAAGAAQIHPLFQAHIDAGIDAADHGQDRRSLSERTV